MHTFIPALGRQRPTNLCESEASLVYRVSSRTATATQRNPISKTNKPNPKPPPHQNAPGLASSVAGVRG